MTMTESHPSTLDGLLARGHELEDQGAIDAARTQYEQALTLFPDSPLPALNLGNAAFAAGDIAQAEHWYRRALDLGPCAPAELNLGNLRLDQRQAQTALQHYRRAATLRSSWPPAILGIANSLIALGQPAEAEACLAMEIARGLRDRACLHLLAELQRPHSASAALETLALDPAPDAETWAFRAKLKTIRLDNRGALEDMLRALELDPENDDYRRFVLFTSMLLDDITPEQLMSWVRKRSRLAGRPLAPRPPLHCRRLKIGYLSCDYRRHAAAHYLYPIIKGHDPARFEVWMLSGTPQHDEVTGTFKSLNAHWVDLQNKTDDSARRAILELELDVIVECSGNTTDSLLRLLDVRLAPLQFAMIGANMTTGSPTIDYRVASPTSDLEEISDRWHQEKILRIREMEFIYDPFSHRHLKSELPAAINCNLTIGFFNNATKLNERTIDNFSELLKNPQMRLMLIGVDHPETRLMIENAIKNRPGKFIIHGRLSHAEYLAAIREADVAWDSFPYSGATTTLDCLLQGVPIITCVGHQSHSRGTSCRLMRLGLQEFVCKDDNERLLKAQALPDRIAFLQRLRQQLPDATREALRTGVSEFSKLWDGELLKLAQNRAADHS